MKAVLLLLVLLVAIPARAQETPAAPEVVKGAAVAKEGDLLTVGGQELRLHGVDAPDRGQTCRDGRGRDYDCFEKSRLALERLTEGKEVACTVKPFVPPNPKPAVCRVEGRDLAATMVAAGWAHAWRRLSGDYVTFERLAQSRRSGFWAGQAEPPWHWRDRERARR
ncbi:MAG TPA: thermonuclease family protein [Azospirillaceae bacterium]|nr:thermonuclease family protein [Azospirillaceae bacterium]